MDELTDYSRSVAAAMGELAPNWVRRYPSEEYGRGAVEFVLPSPSADVPEIVLTTLDDELTFEWGQGQLHMTYPGEGAPARDSVREALELVAEVQAEKWIAVEGRRGRFFGKFWGMIPVAEFEELFAKGRIERARSWRGTFAI